MLFLSFFSYFCSDKTKKKMEETALSGFLSGFATAYFALHAYQLFRRENSSRLQRVVAVIFVQWALFNLKDFFMTMHDYSNQSVHDMLVLIDGTSLIGYTCLIYELIRPGWATIRKVLIMLLAYVPFFATWYFLRDDMVIRCYMACLFLSSCYGYVMPASMSIISETTTLTSIRQIFPGYAWWLGSSSPVNCFGSSSLSSAIR